MQNPTSPAVRPVSLQMIKISFQPTVTEVFRPILITQYFAAILARLSLDSTHAVWKKKPCFQNPIPEKCIAEEQEQENDFLQHT